MAGRVPVRLVVLVACTVVTVGAFSGGSRGGTRDIHDCLWGTPTAAYFVKAKALARSDGVRLLLPTRVPQIPAPRLVSYCPGQRWFHFAWGKRPNPDPTLGAFPAHFAQGQNGYHEFRSYGYIAFNLGQSMTDVLRRNAARGPHATLRLGPWTAYRFGSYRDVRCGSYVRYFFRAYDIVYLVYDNGPCGGGIPDHGGLGDLWGRAGGTAAFIASLRPPY